MGAIRVEVLVRWMIFYIGAAYTTIASHMTRMFLPDCSLQFWFGIKTNPFVDRSRVGLRIHWRHLKEKHLLSFASFSICFPFFVKS